MALGTSSIVHQKDIQRRGGVCARYPVSCLIEKLLCSVGVCGPDYSSLRILDLTYGEGRFWKVFDGLLRPYIVGFDIRKLEWHVRPDEFYRHPSWAWKHLVVDQHFDLVVVDPPWSPWRRGWKRRIHYWLDRMYGRPEDILMAGLEAARHFNALLLVHYKERWVPTGGRVLVEVFFQGWSRLSKTPRPSWFGVLGVV